MGDGHLIELWQAKSLVVVELDRSIDRVGSLKIVVEILGALAQCPIIYPVCPISYDIL